MNNNVYCLGIDTSNYTTSVAIVDENSRVIAENRKMLPVKQGSRGLRQSQALFEHMNQISEVIEMVTRNIDISKVKVVSVSETPRPYEGSYMPVFKSGQSYGRVIAQILGAEYVAFSHQEGHIEAIKSFSSMKESREVVSLHLSGGTTEILRCKSIDNGYEIEIIGGTKDIALGQLLDRTGVTLGIPFPCGSEMDRLASHSEYKKLLTKIPVTGTEINLSGIETQLKRLINDNNEIPKEEISGALFFRIGEALETVIKNACNDTGIKEVIMAGGVSSSLYLRKLLNEKFNNDSNISLEFGKPEYSTDNAVGIALLGMRRYQK